MENINVTRLINAYPKVVQTRLFELRKVIFETASELEITDHLEETLKWGEPAYVSKTGSTLRFDWKEKSALQYSLYFNCKTTLLDTIKERYGKLFEYRGNRELILNIDCPLPIDEIKKCIELSLTYHSIKHLPLLGL